MGHELPDSAPEFDELCERAPAPESVEKPEDCIGGINVHTCYPKVIESLMVVGERDESGGVDSGVIHYTDGRSVGTECPDAWNRHAVSLNLRSGPAEECPVCMGEADPAAMLVQMIDKYMGKTTNALREREKTLPGYDSCYSVYIDTGLRSHPTEILDHMVSHNPYFDIVGVVEVKERIELSFGERIRVELGCRYPDPMPECPL